MKIGPLPRRKFKIALLYKTVFKAKSKFKVWNYILSVSMHPFLWWNTWQNSNHLFFVALASLGSMLETQSLIVVFRCASISWICWRLSQWFTFLRFCQILGISSEYVQSMFSVCSECVQNLYLWMAYNVISCQKVAENTQILKIAKFAM